MRFGLARQIYRAAGSAVQRLIGRVQGLGELFRIAQQVAPGGQLLGLPRFQVSGAELLHRALELVEAHLTLPLSHVELLQGSTSLAIGLVLLREGGGILVQFPEGVEITAVVALIEQRPAVVLPVYVAEHRAQAAQLPGRNALAVDGGAALSLGADSAAYDYTLVVALPGGVIIPHRLEVIIKQPFLGLFVGENRRHAGLRRARAHQLAAHARAKHGLERIYHDTLARAGFARKYVEARSRLYVRALYDRYILNVQLFEHVLPHNFI